ncbi:phosphotransferase KptA/Tpt1, partial [Dendrothele bispora CBS 962.96]
ISKTMSYLLRHGGGEKINMRSDGFVPVKSLVRLSHPSMKGINFSALEMIVKKDNKRRFVLSYETRAAGSSGQVESCWIRANQGHSLVKIPMAVHGTSEKAWQSISASGLSKMARNHIHMAQGLGVDGVVSIRNNSRILIYVNVEKALASRIPFYLSQNGVVLSPGNENGIIAPDFFERVE